MEIKGASKNCSGASFPTLRSICGNYRPNLKKTNVAAGVVLPGTICMQILKNSEFPTPRPIVTLSRETAHILIHNADIEFEPNMRRKYNLLKTAV